VGKANNNADHCSDVVFPWLDVLHQANGTSFWCFHNPEIMTGAQKLLLTLYVAIALGALIVAIIV